MRCKYDAESDAEKGLRVKAREIMQRQPHETSELSNLCDAGECRVWIPTPLG